MKKLNLKPFDTFLVIKIYIKLCEREEIYRCITEISFRIEKHSALLKAIKSNNNSLLASMYKIYDINSSSVEHRGYIT